MTTPESSAKINKMKRAKQPLERKSLPSAAAFHAGAQKLDRVNDLVLKRRKPAILDVSSDSEVAVGEDEATSSYAPMLVHFR